MKKTKKKTVRRAKALSPEKFWLKNPLFMAALLTIMAVLAFILADDWLAFKKSANQPVPTVTVFPTSPKPKY
ncbi:hypothetical protein A3A84_03995 [Candidatus Collierbacteria bacterium RIFCSPLOWO2_01_FULL_50_23]|uniref:Uncharacterized protein n=2 Tax=Candidatus Collieribacteriota TaxID=1752725 RepID=A0A1F5ERE7_9BACT|nr:MAG: hypothetical protein A3D09_03020 [Candidatus Collierbacteria bacterium RIFCSPHIGHO2_02_FULL_49_10]OGD71726.1 MAG: hypothetical protein A2703_03285 [Candidatus Collierbacteria bacterium RIFCSPHIGHO2_01_FULL_50_25]OGD74581.1 MAG: hypothetical protein A3A84_03995 [Candidatus Collierbacteria bacterium RIFCSPLOWO2_01_FULL_50_23]